ncbi:hypothetical protein PIB30_002058 [Stylosanthes scabra]|uniref:Uncharacterized protein n=1 Tax=Stylosanthes scabra TaxID=79078 RepID=A0ABU6Q3S7_9FABA|nr:hypothetical protein [Stylosanthes scabra]
MLRFIQLQQMGDGFRYREFHENKDVIEGGGVRTCCIWNTFSPGCLWYCKPKHTDNVIIEVSPAPAPTDNGELHDDDNIEKDQGKFPDNNNNIGSVSGVSVLWVTPEFLVRKGCDLCKNGPKQIQYKAALANLKLPHPTAHSPYYHKGPSERKKCKSSIAI